MLEKILESPLDYKIKPVHPKGNQHWTFTGRTPAKAEVPIFWSPDANSQLTGKNPDAGTNGKRRRGRQGMRWLDGITDWMDMNLSKLWEIVKNRGAWHATVHGVTKSRTQLSDQTTTTILIFIKFGIYIFLFPLRHLFWPKDYTEVCYLLFLFTFLMFRDLPVIFLILSPFGKKIHLTWFQFF